MSSNTVTSSFHAYRAEHFGFDQSYRRHGAYGCADRELALSLQREWIDGWYRLSFAGRQRRFLVQFLSDWNDLAERVLFYNQLYLGHAPYPGVGAPYTSEAVYRSYVSQSDPRVDDPVADLIAARRWRTNDGRLIAIRPREYTLGVGAIFSSAGVVAEHTVVMADGLERSLPSVGLIAERDETFGAAIRAATRTAAPGSLTSVLFEVVRSGSKPRHRYTATVIGEATPVVVEPAHAIDMQAVLDTLVSEERLAATISGLDPNHCPWR